MVLVPDEQQLTLLVADALRSHDSAKASLLRMLKHSLHNAAIAQGSTLSEQERIAVYRKEVKQRHEAADVFAKGGRTDTALQEQAEAASISLFLPALANRDQVLTTARELLASAQMEGLAPNKGLLIKQIREHLAGNADGKVVAEVVSELLS